MMNEKAAATLLENVQIPSDVTLSDRDLCDLEMLSMGAFAPLKGFHNFNDFCSVVEHSRLCSGSLWPIPIVLPIPKYLIVPSENPTACKKLKLRNIIGVVIAEVDVEDVYEPHFDVVAQKVLGTTDLNHPFARHLHDQACVYVGGQTSLVHPIMHFNFTDLRKTPAEVKQMIKDKNWEVVVGFQTRNPLHRSHFELTRLALKEAEQLTGKPSHLLLTPACGPTQPGDVPYNIRVRCYKKILPYYSEMMNQEAQLVLLPLAMRMAGPREALWHALIRRNFGCTHFVVGRDHAGPSTKTVDGKPFYPPYAAHENLKMHAHEIGIVPIFGRGLFYLGDDLGYVAEDKIPSGVKAHEISGTQFRQLLEGRESVPEWYSFPPIIAELKQNYKSRSELGFCLYFTGLPCSGKSTLASAVEAALQERENERRKVTVFDADIIRTHLSRGLGFGLRDRHINVQRIGYVASLIVQHDGICLVANIAPYEEDRIVNRQSITSTGGGYIEVYVSTPLSVCEERDVKEFYRKARLGVIKQFTGISDPYEVPMNPELVLDSSEDLLGRVEIVMSYLRKHKWII